jgi:DNA-binding MarR family transcriptional regulator
MTSRREQQASRVWVAMREVLHELDDRKREVTAELDLSFVRVRALRRLTRGPLTLRELAGKLFTDAPYTTLIVDDLEARGLVTRTVNPADKRAKVVALTPAGEQLAAKAQAILNRPPEALLNLPAKDLAELERIVEVVLASRG